MKIALCDDEKHELEILAQCIQSYDESLGCQLFSSAAALFAAFAEGFFDIVFLDIEMDAPNGYEIALELMKLRDKPLIIFVTKSNDYTVRGYGVAFRYLQKPVTYEKVAAVLTLALHEVVPQKLSIVNNGRVKLLPVKDIYYFESADHEIKIVTTTGTDTCRMKLSDIARSLQGSPFAQPHKSYYVNLYYVDSVAQEDLTLTSGQKLPVSRSKKKGFTRALMDFIRRK